MSGFETPGRRTAMLALIRGLTLTHASIIGSPLALTNVVEPKRFDDKVPRGQARVHVQNLSGNVSPDGLWTAIAQTWRILMHIPIDPAATQDVADSVQDAVLVALADTTLSGTAHTLNPSVSTQLDDHHLLVEAVVSVGYSRPLGT